MADQKLIIVSGPIAVGKSAIIRCLVQAHRFFRLSSGTYLVDLAQRLEMEPSRLTLVQLGDRLDAETDFGWVVHQVAIPSMHKSPDQRRWVFDSVRKRKQVAYFRSALPENVFHVHLTAPEDVLESRYNNRNRDSDSTTSYSRAIDTDNEREARSLCRIADWVVDTSQADEQEISAQVMEGFLKCSK